jgi:hypothetical protein
VAEPAGICDDFDPSIESTSEEAMICHRNTIERRRSEVMDAFTTCLWFDTEGEEAADFYAGIFPNSSVSR